MPKAVCLSKAEGQPGQVYHPLRLKEVPKPSPEGTQLLLQIHAAALNHSDLFQRQSLYPNLSIGATLLSDGCGTVIALGSSADPKWKSKRVIINPGLGWESSVEGPEAPGGYRTLGGTKLNPNGTLQEYLLVQESEVEEAPSHLSAIEAAALPVAGLTAWRALMVKCGERNVKAGKNLLITGIGGGVALMALHFALLAGANVYVTSGSTLKLQRAASLGAAGGALYTERDWDKQLLKMLGNTKFDAIVDGTGGDIIAKATNLLKPGGVIAVYGMTLGPSMPFTMKAVLQNIEVKGSTAGSRKEFKDMVEFIKQNEIKPVIAGVVRGLDLDAIDGVFQQMRNASQFGKLVIEISREASAAKL